MDLRIALGQAAISARPSDQLELQNLFALNVLLQLVDGLITYRALQIGLLEGNPLLKTSIVSLGSGTALLLFKAKACGILFLLRRSAPPALGAWALWWTAVGYALLAVVPWLGKLLAFAAG